MTVVIALVFAGYLIRSCIVSSDAGEVGLDRGNPIRMEPTRSLAQGQSVSGPDRSLPDKGAREVVADGASIAHGVIVDSQLGAPVAATVIAEDGHGLCTDPQRGTFALDLHSEQQTLVRVVASGYRGRRISLRANLESAPQRIELDALRSAKLWVRHESGQAVEGLPVHWYASNISRSRSQDWKDAEARMAGAGVVTVTNSEGLASIPLGTTGLAIVEDVEVGYRKVLEVLPGEEHVVIIPECGQTVQFLHGKDGSPYAGLRIQTRLPHETADLVSDWTTNAEGIITISEMAFPILLQLHGNASWQHDLTVLSGTAQVSGSDVTPAYLVTMNAVDCAKPVVIGVYACTGQMLLIDSETEEPIEGIATVSYRRDPKLEAKFGVNYGDRYGPALWAHVGYGREAFEVHSGMLSLSCQMRRSDQQLSEMSRLQVSLLVLVSGYAPLRIANLEEVVLPSPSPPQYRLDPVTSRSLQIRFADGQPMIKGVRIRSAEEEITWYISRGTSTGLHGPFDWMGGPLEVSVFDPLDPLVAKSTVTLSAELLRNNELVDVTIAGSTGALEITGIPETAAGIPLIVKLGVGGREPEFSPTEWLPDRCRFTGLPPGEYLAGPRAWVKGSELQGFLTNVKGEVETIGQRVQVRPGETSRVPWQENWGLETELTGTVRVLGQKEMRPWIVPIYRLGPDTIYETHPAPRVSFSRESERLGLDLEGRYRIPPMTPVPELLLICLPDVGSSSPWDNAEALQIVGTIQPGESETIGTGSFELHWIGAPHEKVAWVEYEVPPVSLRHPVHSSKNRSKRYWKPGEVLYIDHVPITVRRFLINGRVLEIEPALGAHQVLEVDVAKLSKEQAQ